MLEREQYNAKTSQAAILHWMAMLVDPGTKLFQVELWTVAADAMEAEQVELYLKNRPKP